MAIISSIGNNDISNSGRITTFLFGVFLVYVFRKMESTNITNLGEITINTVSGDYKIFESGNKAELLHVKSKIDSAIRDSI